MEEGNRLMEEAVRAVARQLEEIVRLQGERMARLEDRMARLEGKLGNVESFKADATAGLPRMPEGVTRPTEEQVREFMRTCMGRTLREDVARKMAREFLGYNNAHGWKNRAGEAIAPWENCAKGWVKKKEGDRGESIYEQEQAAPTPKPKLSVSIGKPKLFGDTFSQISHPSKGRTTKTDER